jgi:hypothetical protein
MRNRQSFDALPERHAYSALVVLGAERIEAAPFAAIKDVGNDIS